MNKKLCIAVVGPTASGKSELAVTIAKQFHGEIISADSRQIYKGLDFGSGKVAGKWNKGRYVYKTIPHYLIDEASPRAQYSVARFQKQARKIIVDIQKRGKLPIICGGTGHWVDAVIYNQTLPEVKPNSALRQQLSHLTPAEMFTMLKRLDPKRAKTIDANNPRRLIRALEIVKTTGQPVPVQTKQENFQTIWIGLKPDQQTLHKKINTRLRARIKQGLLKEVAKLRKQGLSWKKLEAFGLEYKYSALYLQNKLTKAEFDEQLLSAIKKYAKRQMTWWKRNPDIHWFDEPKSAQAFLRKELNN